MVELVSERAAAPRTLPALWWSADLTTRDGCVFHVRPASPADEPALAEFFEEVAKGNEDTREYHATLARDAGSVAARLARETHRGGIHHVEL